MNEIDKSKLDDFDKGEMTENDKDVLEILKTKILKTNKFKKSILEFESCYFNLFKEFNVFLLENEVDDEEIKKEIEDLIKKIKNLLFYEIINYKFPFSLEKEDLLLITYQLLTEKKEKIKLEIQKLRKSDIITIKCFIKTLIRNHFKNLSRNRNRHEIGFIDIEDSNLTDSNEKIDALNNLTIHKKNETKFGDELYRQECETNLLNNIVNHELTKAELKIFQTVYQVENNFKEVKQFNPLTNEEVANELNTTKTFIEKEKKTIHKKIKSAKQKRRLVDLLTITKITNKDFLKTLKCCQLKENQPQITYFSDDENTLYYSEFDKKLVFQLIEKKDNQYKLSKLYFDEIDCIEKEKKIK
ncbi:hypothetical protein [Candidatus Phytoplasma sp. AldY-WA1]|uniref:hypothetical protein n=1 Tax=Candidatus Phytoplasma sp. AldY-WA1 TaxID=2852100 RepID=UPI0025501A6B|nr:hypothetical protein [Candidatus Phytoplasma sp. AldY-WA1]